MPGKKAQARIRINRLLEQANDKPDNIIYEDRTTRKVFQSAFDLERDIKRGGTVHSLQNGFLRAFQVRVPPLETQQTIAAEVEKEQATLTGVAEVKAKFEARITARLVAVWGAAPVPVVEAAAQKAEPVRT
jgi:restriction endonuclease S subunit